MRITINGEGRDLAEPMLTYEALARLVGERHPSVTYRHRESGLQGILHPGESLTLITGMVINAYTTSSA